VNLFTPVLFIHLGKQVSPKICVGQFNHQNYIGTRCKPNSLSNTAQCNSRENVLYGPYLLRGASQSWWESYLTTHADPEAITWKEFRENFRQYHVPEGLMIVKKEEFLALK
jgi:hypothetical protein